uniref:EF-hand domain-containing protein n=1 Tax=Plectus sambesii TaxID=2011161 RepID=A0A914XSU6_9BILA
MRSIGLLAVSLLLLAIGAHGRSENTFFAKADINGDGAASFEEFRQALESRQKKPQPGATRRLFERADTDKDGRITPVEYTELLSMAKGIRQAKDRKKAETAKLSLEQALLVTEGRIPPDIVSDSFAIADKDQDGYLVGAELEAGLDQIKRKLRAKFSAVYTRVDTDHNLHLNLEETINFATAFGVEDFFIEENFDLADIDDDNQLSAQELEAFFKNSAKERKAAASSPLVKRFDADHSGTLSTQEALRLAEHLDSDMIRAKQAIFEADVDRNGQLDS